MSAAQERQGGAIPKATLGKSKGYDGACLATLCTLSRAFFH